MREVLPRKEIEKILNQLTPRDILKHITPIPQFKENPNKTNDTPARRLEPKKILQPTPRQGVVYLDLRNGLLDYTVNIEFLADYMLPLATVEPDDRGYPWPRYTYALESSQKLGQKLDRIYGGKDRR